MNNSRHILLLSLLLICVGQSLFAQTVDDARKCFERGQYSTAVAYYNTLIEEYRINNYSVQNLQQARDKASQCQKLLSEAATLSRKEQYSKAIEKYQAVKKINPSDPNVSKRIKECERLRDEYLKKEAVEADWNNCRTIDDYRSFRWKHPNSKYDQQAQNMIKELERKNDESAWRMAKETNTISAFESYLRNYKIHESDAKRRLGDLYELKAFQYYKDSQFAFAKSCYEEAKKYKTLPEGSSKYYSICCEEVAFNNLKNKNKSDRHRFDIEMFLSKYPDSKYTKIVKGYFLDFCCFNGHQFDEARKYIDKEQYAATDDGVLRDKRWWKKYINEAERQYKKSQKAQPNYRNNTGTRAKKSSSYSDPVYSSKKKPAYSSSSSSSTPVLIRIPIHMGMSNITETFRTTMGSEAHAAVGILRPGIGIGIGGYDNRFNFDVLASYFACGDVDYSFLISLAPSFNVVKYDERYTNYHINVQPSFGWHTVAGPVGGLRVGVGFYFSDFSVGAMYGNKTGFFYDVTFRMNINLGRIKR